MSEDEDCNDTKQHNGNTCSGKRRLTETVRQVLIKIEELEKFPNAALLFITLRIKLM